MKLDDLLELEKDCLDSKPSEDQGIGCGCDSSDFDDYDSTSQSDNNRELTPEMTVISDTLRAEKTLSKNGCK